MPKHWFAGGRGVSVGRQTARTERLAWGLLRPGARQLVVAYWGRCGPGRDQSRHGIGNVHPQRRLHMQVESICEADPTTAPSLATAAGTKLSVEVLHACPPERAGGVTGLSTLDLWGSPDAHCTVANSEAVGSSICSCQRPSSLPQPELAELAREAKAGESLPLGRDLACATGSSWQRLKAESSWEEGVTEEFRGDGVRVLIWIV